MRAVALAAVLVASAQVARADSRAAVVNVTGVDGATVAARLRQILQEQRRLSPQPKDVTAALEGQQPPAPDFAEVRRALAEFRYQDAERELASMVDALLAHSSSPIATPLASVFGWRGLLAAVDDRAKPQEQRKNAKQFFAAALALDEELTIDPAMTSPRVRLLVEEARRQRPDMGELVLTVTMARGGKRRVSDEELAPSASDTASGSASTSDTSVELSVDGKPSAPFGSSIPVAVGWHLLRVTAPERAPTYRVIEVSKGAPTRVQIELEPEAKSDKVLRLVGETASVPEGRARLAAAVRLGAALGSSRLLVLESFESQRAKIRLYDVSERRISQQFSFSQADSTAAVSAAVGRAFEMSGSEGPPPRWYQRWQVWAGAGAVVAAGIATAVIVSSLQEDRVTGL